VHERDGTASHGVDRAAVGVADERRSGVRGGDERSPAAVAQSFLDIDRRGIERGPRNSPAGADARSLRAARPAALEREEVIRAEHDARPADVRQRAHVRARNATFPYAAFAPLGASPLGLLTYAAPIGNDVVTVDFKQSIGATDALRTGSYSKTLVYTLSTTNP
jgi:hypothetical protein